MNKITAIILTKNEEEMLEDCLTSLSFCQELVIIDSGSTDKTLEIAKRYKAKVFEDTSDDFAQKRNKGLQHSSNKWIFYIDADERVSPQLKDSIEEILSSKSPLSAYSISRKNYYLGRHEWPGVETFLRLFDKEKLLHWEGKLHESAKVVGETGILEGNLIHFTHRNLSSMLEKTIVWSETEAKLRIDAHHPRITWWRLPRVMITAFFDSYVKQKGYKVGTVGIIESMYQAFSMGITYARVWELQQKNREL